MPTKHDAVLNIALYRIAELERRLNNVMRPAKVTEVDPAKSIAKVTYASSSEGEPVESDWIPWTESAGDIKSWSPVSIGEQLMMMSPSGEMGRHSWLMRGGFSNENPKPHNKSGEQVTTVGGNYRNHIDANGSREETLSGNLVTKTNGKVFIN